MSSRRPFLTTARLELWQPAVGDEHGLYALTADAAMRQHLAFAEPSLADSGARLLRSAGSWTLYGYGPLFLRRPGDQRIIGNCGVFHSWRGFGKGMDNVPEAGWIVARDRWGVGYAGEAMRAILAWWDDAHPGKRIACMIAEGNAASHRLAGKFGFEPYDSHADDRERLVLYERRVGAVHAWPAGALGS